MKSLDIIARFICKFFFLTYVCPLIHLAFFLLLSYLKSFLLSLISLCLQALLDHFGYDVAYSHDWHSPTCSNGGQGDNIDANENNGSTRMAGSLLRLAQDNALFLKLGFNKFYLLSHTILMKGAGNIIFGSHDKKFPFLSQSKYVPINPLIHVSHVTQEDFK